MDNFCLYIKNNLKNKDYPEYRSDVALCQSIHKKYGKSFYLGTILLPKEEREAACILYAFFRYPDEYVDTYFASQKSIALEKLNEWKSIWNVYYHDLPNNSTLGKNSDQTRILRATTHIFKKYKIPYQYSEAFLASMIQDTSKEHYANYLELKEYMHGSAVVVGLMMCYILCSNDKKFQNNKSHKEFVLHKAEKLGEAFQMTNILRDISDDFSVRGRIYVPQDELRKFNITKEQMSVYSKTKRVDENFVKLMKFQIERTEKLYAEADKGISMLPIRASKSIAVARAVYHQIIGEIVSMNYNVFKMRAHVAKSKKITTAARVIILGNNKVKKYE